MSDSIELNLPDCNADEVARDLVAQTADLDGSGFVRVFGLLLARAEEHQRILAHSAKTSQAMLSGNEPITQEGVNAHALEAIYETTCLKLLLARTCAKIAQDLENDLHQRQTRFPRIKTVVYSSNGEVESYTLDKG